MITTLVRPATTITQETLSKIVHLRRELQELESWASEVKARLSSEEDQVIKSLEDNVPVETGERIAKVKTFTKRIVAWKDAFVKYLGVALAEKVCQKTEPTLYKRLEVI